MFPPPGFIPTSLSTSLPASSLTSSTSLLPSAALAATATGALSSPSTSGLLSSTLVLASSVASATAVAASAQGPDDADGGGECRLLGPFALFIQGALGLLAMLSLVWKRYRERPQRPLKIWAFDVSKQVVGSVLVHIANLLMSMLSAGQFTVKPKMSAASSSSADGPDQSYTPNPCSFYLLNLAIDVSHPSWLMFPLIACRQPSAYRC